MTYPGGAGHHALITGLKGTPCKFKGTLPIGKRYVNERAEIRGLPN